MRDQAIVEASCRKGYNRRAGSRFRGNYEPVAAAQQVGMWWGAGYKGMHRSIRYLKRPVREDGHFAIGIPQPGVIDRTGLGRLNGIQIYPQLIVNRMGRVWRGRGKRDMSNNTPCCSCSWRSACLRRK